MKKIFQFSGLMLLLTILFISCDKADVKPEIKDLDKPLLTSKVLEGTPVKLKIHTMLDSSFVGYNPLYITLTDSTSGNQVSNATMTISTLMDMGTMKHASPVEQPAYNTTNKYYQGAAVFTMPTMNEMGWVLKINVNYNGKDYPFEITVVVKATGTANRWLSIVKDASDNSYFLALVHPLPKESKVGINDLEVAVFKKSTMMEFPPVPGLSLAFTPTMPSMGHSSPNNVNPTDVGKGHYKGKVNYTMTGDWRLDFTISGITDHAIIDVLF